jgi:hypothetical protein
VVVLEALAITRCGAFENAGDLRWSFIVRDQKATLELLQHPMQRGRGDLRQRAIELIDQRGVSSMHRTLCVSRLLAGRGLAGLDALERRSGAEPRACRFVGRDHRVLGVLLFNRHRQLISFKQDIE